MHAHAADVELGDNFAIQEHPAGPPGLWEGQGLWMLDDRALLIYLSELRAVQLVMYRFFADFVSLLDFNKLVLHKDNQTVAYILNAMLLVSLVITKEPRKLKKFLKVFSGAIEARWLPSAVNRLSGALSQTWDPRNARATGGFLQFMF